MFCPECKTEYRPGFTRCSDCGVALVNELPPEAHDDMDDSRVVWTGNIEADCVSACLSLKDAGIPYKVSQFSETRFINSVGNWRYEIAVPSSSFSRAQELLGTKNLPAIADGEESPGDQDSIELPAEDDSPGDEPVENNSYFSEWFPEDATEEVWSQAAADASTFVELSLKENRIHFRSDLQEDGTHKIFVLPEDKSRASEIVREIVDGTPP